MNISIKRYIVLAFLVLVISIMTSNIHYSKAAENTVTNTLAETNNEYNEDVVGIGTISIDSSAFSNESASPYSIKENGNIIDDGVRLRKAPNKNSAILELLYNGETVVINYTKSFQESNGTWFYLKRVKTGTWGWVNRKYVSEWN